jgi:hypothetical protein
MADIVQSDQIQSILTNDALQGPQKAEQIRHIIRTLRYPQFTELEQRYHHALQQLQLPKNVRMQADRFFEDDRLSVAFQFQTPEELHHIAERLTELANQPELSQILQIIQAKEE